MTRVRRPTAGVHARILALARRQGYLTVAELAKLLPADTSVEDTHRLLEALKRSNLPLLGEGKTPDQNPESTPVRAAPGLPLLTRAEEQELALRIQEGHRHRIRAAALSPATASRLIRAAKQVATGSCLVWEILADYEGSDPDQDEAQAGKRLAELARILVLRQRELGRFRTTRRSPPLTLERWQQLDAIRNQVAEAILSLDFRDTFMDRLLLPLTAEASKVESAQKELAALEQTLRQPAGCLGDCERLPDRTLRRVLKACCLPKGEEERVKAQVKNLKRRIRSAARTGHLSPRDLLLVANEIHAGARQSDAARQRLVEANQRLVIGIARHYPLYGLDFLDLVQEGNLGLMRAADRFDPALGFRFGTYATWWVRQSIGRLLAEQGGSVRIPPHVQESLHKLNRISRRLVLQTGKEPTVEELAIRLGKSPERIKEILSAGIRPVSADAPSGDFDESSSLLEFIPDPHARPDEEADRRVRQTVLQHAMEALNPREQEIVQLRFIDGLTLQEVGRRFRITRERTRQLQEQAIGKLRKRIKADLLRRLTKEDRRTASRRIQRIRSGEMEE